MEIQDFRSDSPCGSKIGIQLALTLIVSTNGLYNQVMSKTAFLYDKAIERTIFYVPFLKQKLIKSRSFKNVLTDQQMLQELLNASASRPSPGFFYWSKNKVYRVYNLSFRWHNLAGSEIFESNIISIRKQHLNFGLNLQIFLLMSASSYHKLKIFC